MTDKLTPTQTLLVWCLLAKQGIARQADIMPAPKAADRKVLETARFVSVTKRARSLWIKLEDRGWGWADDHLRDPLPPAHGALHGIMTRLHHHLAKSDEGLGDFIGVAPERFEKPEPGKPSKAESQPKVSLRTIKAAYMKASGKQTNVRVLLSDLRNSLQKYNKAELDNALRGAHLAGKVTLMRLDNPAELTANVRAAQLDFKGESMHLIWIQA